MISAKQVFTFVALISCMALAACSSESDAPPFGGKKGSNKPGQNPGGKTNPPSQGTTKSKNLDQITLTAWCVNAQDQSGPFQFLIHLHNDSRALIRQYDLNPDKSRGAMTAEKGGNWQLNGDVLTVSAQGQVWLTGPASIALSDASPTHAPQLTVIYNGASLPFDPCTD